MKIVEMVIISSEKEFIESNVGKLVNGIAHTSM